MVLGGHHQLRLGCTHLALRASSGFHQGPPKEPQPLAGVESGCVPRRVLSRVLWPKDSSPESVSVTKDIGWAAKPIREIWVCTEHSELELSAIGPR